MDENTLATIIISKSIEIHRQLGPGLFESVYEAVLAQELIKIGVSVQRQQAVSISYNGCKYDEGFRADLIAHDKVIVELKSVEKVLPVHKKQLLTYLRLADKKLGLLINFGEVLLKDGITRIANDL